MSQKYTKEELENMVPIFHLKPETSTRAKSVLTYYVKNNERINDDELEIDVPKEIKEKIGNNTLLLGQINNYVIVGKYCACNVPGGYLVSNSKIPIYYLSVIYNRKFITGCLFNIFLYFDIDDETKKKLDVPKKYYKAFMNGKFTIQFVPTDDNFLDKIKKYVEIEVLKKYQKNIDECKHDLDKQDQVMEKVIEDIENEMNLYKKFIDNSQSFGDSVPTQKAVFKKLNSICDSPVFKMLLIYGLMLREKERIEERCPDGVGETYKTPKNVINLKEIKEHPEKLDKIMEQKKRDTNDSDNEQI